MENTFEKSVATGKREKKVFESKYLNCEATVFARSHRDGHENEYFSLTDIELEFPQERRVIKFNSEAEYILALEGVEEPTITIELTLEQLGQIAGDKLTQQLRRKKINDNVTQAYSYARAIWDEDNLIFGLLEGKIVCTMPSGLPRLVVDYVGGEE